MPRERVLILGAAGRDFHHFNTCFRDDKQVEVVGFTATQIPHIVDRRYPPELAGPAYPNGLPIYEESRLEALVREHRVDRVVFAYSDLGHEQVMHLASRALAAGASFSLSGGERTMIPSNKPVIALCAVRTGCGKSPAARRVATLLREAGLRVAVVRHPMPYGDLAQQAVQRFVTPEDLDTAPAGITIEEREEYEPHLALGHVVFAGVDYGAILQQAEADADVVLWDGGNNDLPFYRPNLWITLADPHRAGHELHYHPGEANVRAADVVLINKADTAPPGSIDEIRSNVAVLNPSARIAVAKSEVFVDSPERIRGKRVLVVDDGPTLTHGGMAFGAGHVAAERLGAEIVDPRPAAVGSIAALYRSFPHLGPVVPAMGYYPEQIAELRATLNGADCDAVIVATPADIRRLLGLDKPAVRVNYEVVDVPGETTLTDEIRRFVANLGSATRSGR